MSLTASGLLLDLTGVILLAVTTLGFVKDKGTHHGDVSWVGMKIRKSRFSGGKLEEFVDTWGSRAGWFLLMLGFALQLVDELLA